MMETAEELAALQRLLDDSINSSGHHVNRIVSPRRRLSARQLVTALTGMKVLVVATGTARGEPRTSCVDGHFRNGRWIFCTSERAVKARHLRARPAVSVTHADGERMAVFVHGHAEYIVPADPAFAPLDAHYVDHYGSSPREWGPTPVFVRVHPHWMVGYAMDAVDFPDA
ncbi:pyridoxamine 5'-phosphate oxidase family protein [Pseudonocardia sp. TRM90224]|uniref:pyridoxamine 5'-phosphate oxidase family protein n=1 Tax=Pseudonocardia sp. TRM90224 TaxID=2812678 RepID=UPI001E459156|nr:pyridoxamine 5'-phosphate oxidase family protein [Pseudonocardia sp. TRM90224]